MLRTATLLLIGFCLGAVADTAKRADEAYHQGLEYLLKRQNPDGSWGSGRNTKDLNIYMPGAESHMSVRCSVTSLAIMALLDTEDQSPNVSASLKKGTNYLFQNLPKVKRPGFDVRWVGNNWTHAYALRALVGCLNNKELSLGREEVIKQLIKGQIDRLRRYVYPGGGWGYYDFENRMRRPAGHAASFITASVLIALHEVKEAGLDFDESLAKSALNKLERLRKPDFSYLYSYDHPLAPVFSVNNKSGSLARSQSCNQALYLWQTGKVTQDVLDEWLRRITSGQDWLKSCIKTPKPHVGFNNIASYFFYNGYFYACTTLPLIENPKRRHTLAQGLAEILIENQEANGAWFDFPLYDYGHAYGTAYGLMAINSCRRAMLKQESTPSKKKDSEQSSEGKLPQE